MARYMAQVAPLITVTILCGRGISYYINCDLLFQYKFYYKNVTTLSSNQHL